MDKKKMKAIVATGYGSPGVFQLKELDVPVPKANEVLVKVVASAATRADGMMRTGKPYIGRLFTGLFKPRHPIPGTGFAGLVSSVGEAVAAFKPGDRVFGETTLGFSTNAEYVALPWDGVILPMPVQLTFDEAATLCDGPLTSYNFLKQIAGVSAGQEVLINGASGSLGTAAVQLARYYQARVTAICSTRNMGLVQSLGAHAVIDYTRQDFTKQDKTYDIIFDTVGKSSFSRCRRILSETGMYLSPVLRFSTFLEMIQTSLYGKQKARFDATGAKPAEQLRSMLATLVAIIETGSLKTIIDRRFPLEKLAEAHRYIAGGHKAGNVVITINP